MHQHGHQKPSMSAMDAPRHVCYVMVQLDEARKQLDARQKTRAREGIRLRNALTNLEAQAAADAQQVISAQQAHKELLQNLPAYLSPAAQARPPPPSLAPKCTMGKPAPPKTVQAIDGVLAPSQQLPRPVKNATPKLMPSHSTPSKMTPVLAPQQAASGAAVKSEPCVIPTRVAPTSGSMSARKAFSMQQAAWHSPFLHQASTPTRHACMAVKQNAQPVSLPQGAYSIQWLAATLAQAQVSNPQQTTAATWEGSQPPLRHKLSSLSETAECLSGTAAVATASNALTQERAGAAVGITNYVMSRGAEPLQEGLMTQQMGSVTQQGSLMTQQKGTIPQQHPRLPLPWARTATAMHAAQKPLPSSSPLSAQAAQTHPAAIHSSCTAKASVVLPQAAVWARTPCQTGQPGQAISGCQDTLPPLQAQQPHSRHCCSQAVPESATLALAYQPALLTAARAPSAVAPSFTACPGPLDGESVAQPAAAAPAASVTPASCVTVQRSSLQAIASQQKLCSAMPARVNSSQAAMTQAGSYPVKASPQTCTHMHCHLQAPTHPLTAASASCMLPVSAAHGSSLVMHPGDANSPGCQILPPQHATARKVGSHSSAAQGVGAVSSAGGTATAQAPQVKACVAQGSGAQSSSPQPSASEVPSSRVHASHSVHSSSRSAALETHSCRQSLPESTPAACISLQLHTPASSGLPTELLALFIRPSGYTPKAPSSKLPPGGPSTALPSMQAPTQSAFWQTGSLQKPIRPDHERFAGQQQAKNPGLRGMY